MLEYDFGRQHPLKPERLRRTITLLENMGVEMLDPGEGKREDILRMHSAEYVDFVTSLFNQSPLSSHSPILPFPFGIGPGDTPSFPKIYQASLAYSAGSVAAARDVVNGAKL